MPASEYGKLGNLHWTTVTDGAGGETLPAGMLTESTGRALLLLTPDLKPRAAAWQLVPAHVAICLPFLFAEGG